MKKWFKVSLLMLTTGTRAAVISVPLKDNTHPTLESVGRVLFNSGRYALLIQFFQLEIHTDVGLGIAPGAVGLWLLHTENL